MRLAYLLLVQLVFLLLYSCVVCRLLIGYIYHTVPIGVILLNDLLLPPYIIKVHFLQTVNRLNCLAVLVVEIGHQAVLELHG